jgi:hypothetical protein
MRTYSQQPAQRNQRYEASSCSLRIRWLVLQKIPVFRWAMSTTHRSLRKWESNCHGKYGSASLSGVTGPYNRSLYIGRFLPTNLQLIRASKQYSSFATQMSGELIAYTVRWTNQVDHGLVNKRAWVFQERILSPRIIHFARDQIFWECASLWAADASSFDDITLYSGYAEFLKRGTRMNHPVTWTLCTRTGLC